MENCFFFIVLWNHKLNFSTVPLAYYPHLLYFLSSIGHEIWKIVIVFPQASIQDLSQTSLKLLQIVLNFLSFLN